MGSPYISLVDARMIFAPTPFARPNTLISARRMFAKMQPKESGAPGDEDTLADQGHFGLRRIKRRHMTKSKSGA
jgi:hypothetical protein